MSTPRRSRRPRNNRPVRVQSSGSFPGSGSEVEYAREETLAIRLPNRSFDDVVTVRVRKHRAGRKVREARQSGCTQSFGREENITDGDVQFSSNKEEEETVDSNDSAAVVDVAGSTPQLETSSSSHPACETAGSSSHEDHTLLPGSKEPPVIVTEGKEDEDSFDDGDSDDDQNTNEPEVSQKKRRRRKKRPGRDASQTEGLDFHLENFPHMSPPCESTVSSPYEDHTLRPESTEASVNAVEAKEDENSYEHSDDDGDQTLWNPKLSQRKKRRRKRKSSKGASQAEGSEVAGSNSSLDNLSSSPSPGESTTDSPCQDRHLLSELKESPTAPFIAKADRNPYEHCDDDDKHSDDEQTTGDPKMSQKKKRRRKRKTNKGASTVRNITLSIASMGETELLGPASCWRNSPKFGPIGEGRPQCDQQTPAQEPAIRSDVRHVREQSEPLGSTSLAQTATAYAPIGHERPPRALQTCILKPAKPALKTHRSTPKENTVPGKCVSFSRSTNARYEAEQQYQMFKASVGPQDQSVILAAKNEPPSDPEPSSNGRLAREFEGPRPSAEDDLLGIEKAFKKLVVTRLVAQQENATTDSHDRPWLDRIQSRSEYSYDSVGELNDQWAREIAHLPQKHATDPGRYHKRERIPDEEVELRTFGYRRRVAEIRYKMLKAGLAHRRSLKGRS